LITRETVIGETPAVAATSLMVGALRWRREVFWFNLFSGDAGVAAPKPAYRDLRSEAKNQWSVALKFGSRRIDRHPRDG
jgi:hypothetical protein